MAAIENTYKKYPQYGVFFGIAKGVVDSNLSKRSEQELRKDISDVLAIFNNCLEVNVVTNNTGHIPEDG